eukprot:Plantae.Rhodophyta-Purpureofilum_apyrenoidigerum.ctg6100.p1 GENE.Plantae.Rhodophyta-Purpureofilum_apyrenoidigerum.ctg6100~~Plantae.Rhodophyta-Purpureofilum_apyrenoidigerum.ctg6100.p1  ORF type:complete len:233 (-),score=48.26 Plantae.Rhodophyta-Purpureofilum_apyrenoidigerum.ctg6100:2002-2700(-)
MADATMNIDRPLDDIVNDARKQRMHERRVNTKRRPGKPRPKNGQAVKGSDAMVIDTKPSFSGGIQKRLGGKPKGKKREGGVVSAAAFKAAAAEAGLTGSRVEVSNLGPSVSTKDISDLFSGIGPLEKAEVNFDSKHRSAGTATVIFKNRADAVEAIKRYNDVPLDNKPLKLSLSTKSGPQKKDDVVRIEVNVRGKSNRKVTVMERNITGNRKKKPMQRRKGNRPSGSDAMES